MMTKCWEGKFGGRLEEHTYEDGSKHYSLRGKLGRPCNVEEENVFYIINKWMMEDVTEKYIQEGWVRRF